MLRTSRDWLMFMYAACCGGSSLLVHPCIIILSYLSTRNCPGALGHPTPVQECYGYERLAWCELPPSFERTDLAPAGVQPRIYSLVLAIFFVASLVTWLMGPRPAECDVWTALAWLPNYYLGWISELPCLVPNDRGCSFNSHGFYLHSLLNGNFTIMALVTLCLDGPLLSIIILYSSHNFYMLTLCYDLVTWFDLFTFTLQLRVHDLLEGP